MNEPWRSSILDRLFVDTSAYFALYSADDEHHARAVSTAATAHGRLLTTNYIIAETHALFLRRVGRNAGVLFLEETDRSNTVVERVSAEDEMRAREIIFSQMDKDYSLTDATSFAVMERLGITMAFTFDRHFAQYGFAVLGLNEP
jgi:predicted nucleic acid-binding protein